MHRLSTADLANADAFIQRFYSLAEPLTTAFENHLLEASAWELVHDPLIGGVAPYFLTLSLEWRETKLPLHMWIHADPPGLALRVPALEGPLHWLIHERVVSDDLVFADFRRILDGWTRAEFTLEVRRAGDQPFCWTLRWQGRRVARRRYLLYPWWRKVTEQVLSSPRLQAAATGSA